MITEDSARQFADFVKDNPTLNLPEIADKKDIKISSAERYVRACLNEYNLLDQEPPLTENVDEPEIADKDPDKENQVEKEYNLNNLEVTSRSERIKTLDDLLEAGEVDLDVWEVEHYVENKWDGQLKGGAPVPLWQVKAWLQKRVLTEKEFEPVTPIELDTNFQQPSGPVETDVNRAVVIPDVHIGYRRDSYSHNMIPFHDRRCLDLDLQLINEYEPELVVLLGDLLDMPNWSDKFTRSPEFANILQAAVNEGHWWLRNIREIVPDAQIVYIQGNHEERLPRFQKKNVKAAYGVKPATATEDDPDLLSIESLLDLRELNIKWIGDYPDGGHWINDNLVAEHGERSSSVNGKSAGQVLDDARASHLFAHTHRLEMATTTAYPKGGPKMYQSVSLGCQCRIGGETPGTKKKQDWQNAVGLVEFETGNSSFRIEPIFINDGELIHNGQKYSGENRLEQLRAEADLEKYNFVEF